MTFKKKLNELLTKYELKTKMKNLLYLSLIFIVFSCNSIKNKTEHFEERYEEIIPINKNSVINKNLFGIIPTTV